MTVSKRTRPRQLTLSLVVIAIVLVFYFTATDQYLYVGDSALVAAIGAIGLNVLTGRAGQVSIGNAAFIGLGAYSAVLLQDHLPFLVIVLVGGVVAAIAGLAIGLPSLRLRGLYLVFSTLALQFIASFAFTEYDSKSGAISGHEIKGPTIAGWSIDADKKWFWFLLVAVAIVVIVVSCVVRGRPGRAWDAIRANETSAAIMGVNVRRAKLSAFMFSSFIVGMCGAITAYFVQNVSGDYFTLNMAVSYVAMILIGGLGSMGGAIAGAIVVTALPTLTTTVGSDLFNAGSSTGFIQQNLSAIDAGVYGLLILVFMFTEPKGLVGIYRRLEDLVLRRLPRRPTSSSGDGRPDKPGGPADATPSPPPEPARPLTTAVASPEDAR